MVSGIYFFEVPDGSQRHWFDLPLHKPFCPPSPKGKDRPPTPFPSGEGGEPKFIFARGYRPLHPRDLYRKVCWLNLRFLFPTGKGRHLRFPGRQP